MSVLVVGVDAVSRLNFYRQMPETAAFLKELGAFEMLGYNKVEDNTFPNLVPVLTGLTEAELKATCWPSTSSVFDDCPFLWKRYSEAGFLTAYGEDASWMGTFNYMKNGFHKQPTDFYLQIFNHVAEKEAGHEKRLNANLCVGKRLNLDMLLGGVASFALGSLGAPFFGFFWGGSLSHDFLNLPRLGDKSHLKMLQLFKDQGLLERTVFVLMSDHGIRWGGIRETYQGYLEERLPFLFLVLPQWFREEFPTAVSYLRLNGRRLTTPFDLHETLKDLVDLKGLRKNEIKKRMQSDTPGGRSLFLPISDERNCTSARIADNWCTCHQSEPLSANSSGAVQAARALVGRLNALLDGHRECARLDVGSVISARLEVPTSHLSAPKETIPVKDYTVTVRTRPGGGLFEATVRRDPGGYKVVGTVSRINTYGDQSACIAHYKLKLYCFCLPR
ncbi:hypothetical protein AAG570_002082 [Ranatra chinensis]|uniref:Uncharacterized protein n=1 Tax=Ranatra chinensis TaxID=642074 RepID=A0ABD0YB76_9HEMI